jgi:hypothetical protein
MAFNITITKIGAIDWIILNKTCTILDREFVTVFPIQQSDFLKESGIGLSINFKKDYREFWKTFEPFLVDLYDKGFIITELYSGLVINPKDVNELKEMIK